MRARHELGYVEVDSGAVLSGRRFWCFPSARLSRAAGPASRSQSMVFSDVPSGASLLRRYRRAVLGGRHRWLRHVLKARCSVPAASVLRAQFAKMILGVLEIPVAESEWQDTSRPFIDFEADDPGNLYPHDYVAAAFRLGITTGKTATTFEPYVDIRRIQVISMVVRAAKANKPGAVLDPPSDWSGCPRAPTTPTPTTARTCASPSTTAFSTVWWDSARAGTRTLKATRGEAAQIMWNLYLAEDSGLPLLRRLLRPARVAGRS